MRIVHLLTAAAICSCGGIGSAEPTAAPAQPKAARAPPPVWLVTETHVGFTPAPIALPLKAGVLTATKHSEASHQGENLDNMIEYRSPDGAVFGTVYIYYPGLAHVGLAAIAQDLAIHANSSTNVASGEMRVQPAGGMERAAIRQDYSHYRGNLASSGAYMKVGRWLVTVRVSGPEGRKADVSEAIDALLKGILFGRASPAHEATLISLSDCPKSDGGAPAKPLPDLHGAQLGALALLADFDGGGNEATDEHGARKDLPPRVPPELCRTSLQLKQGSVTLLKGADGDSIFVDGRSVRLALLNDAGRTLEVDHVKNFGGYVVLYHDIGETDFLGLYDGIPSDRQLADILDGTDKEGTRIRVPVRFIPGEGPQIYLPGGPVTKPAPAQPATSSR